MISCEIGKKLDVDVVLLVSIVTGRHGTYEVDCYLINTHDQSVFKRSDSLAPSRFNAEIKTITKLFFADYRKFDLPD